MVSTTAFGSTMEERYKFGVSDADFRSSGPLLTSASQQANFDAAIHQTSKDIIKRKLTARVSPMTRHHEQGLDRRLHPLVVAPNRGKAIRTYGVSTKTQLTDIGATTSVIKRGQQKLAEKRKFRATNVIIAAKTVKSESSLSKREEPVTKRPRPILPRTMEGKVSKDLIA